jgi:two-component system chemotaxis response regulator CheY
MQALVVDDSRAMRTILTRLMTDLGFSVITADDGAEALEILDGGARPDVAMVDWNMPVMDGITFLRRLRAMPGGKRPKVLFCTIETRPERIAEALAAGADDYVMKPFDGEILQSKLTEVGAIAA